MFFPSRPRLNVGLYFTRHPSKVFRLGYMTPDSFEIPQLHGPVADAARGLAERLSSAGYEALFVGGAVRDGLLGLPVKDVDLVTDARPEQIEELFEGVQLVGASFGVCLVPWGEHTFEVATYRRDGAYLDHRRPASVEFGTREQDALRRDFSVNALYYDPVRKVVLDEVGGREDLARGIIRTVGEPAARFREDALRLLRAVRFAARLSFEIEPQTWSALRRASQDIRHVSPERIREELTLMLLGPAPSRAMQLMDEAGLLGEILPEVVALKGVEQSPEHHPEGDVFTHTMLVIDAVEPRTTIACWGALLHDIAKPQTRARQPNGRITFYGHERIGAEHAAEICRRLRFSNETTRQISDVVARHMRFIHASEWKESTMRRFLAADTIEDDLAVHRSDCLGSHGRLTAWELVRNRLSQLRERQEAPLPEPLLTGRDLIEMGLQPGPTFRVILDEAQDLQLNSELSTREEALQWLATRVQDQSNP